MNKKILIIALTDLSKSPRPLKQIKALRDKYEIHTVGLKKSHLEHKFFPIRKRPIIFELLILPVLLFRLYHFYFWNKEKRNLLNQLKKENYSIIIVHEIRMMPLGSNISTDSQIVLDAHEYSPNNFDDNFIWKFFIKQYYIDLCSKYLPKCNRIITVCDGIANLYEKNFNIECDVITNAAEYSNIEPSNINPNKIKIIHHGNASSSRKLELMIEMMQYLDEKYFLYLMLVATRTNKFYLNKLKKLSRNNKNIIFLDPIPFKNIVNHCNRFDIGIQFHPPVNLNLKYGLGNKFFEFIQSRLVIAIGPAIEMQRYVKKYNLGIISDTFNPEDMAELISHQSISDLNFYKQQCHINAKKMSSNENDKHFVNIINGMLS